MVNLQFKILVIQLAIFNFGKSRYSVILEILSISVFKMGSIRGQNGRGNEQNGSLLII